jgi:hypothetical protein
MRSPNVLDVVHAVTDLAASHSEVAVWWYMRAGVAGSPVILLVLEPRDGALPDTASIGAALAARFGPEAVAVRMHRGAGETQTLYRLLTAANASAAVGHAEGW